MVNERTILIADDESALRDIGREFVTALFPDYNSETFCDGEELKGRLEQGVSGVALVITDNTMPGLTGSDVIREYSGRPGMPPMILATGDGKEVGEAALRMGAFGYLEKPYRMAQFEDVVGRALDSRQSS